MVAIHPWPKATSSASDDDCGSFEVWFADGRKSARFYWDNLVSRRLSPNTLTRDQAIERATALARAEMDKLDNPE